VLFIGETCLHRLCSQAGVPLQYGAVRVFCVLYISMVTIRAHDYSRCSRNTLLCAVALRCLSSLQVRDHDHSPQALGPHPGADVPRPRARQDLVTAAAALVLPSPGLLPEKRLPHFDNEWLAHIYCIMYCIPLGLMQRVFC